ncbi:hypothetical protein BT96DRAFT_1010785 [Gymnopus androsaceus JB14]|uniref:Uncharacterized protein n=1 Tax=Gymnopus androsaceus JB14 TaxID=1447944 RepID=A0A6A4GA59_9AGAR|nr:hypothetical protein BT96DRAFT_1010785 [Gymnopus androsaceus JB14]
MFSSIFFPGYIIISNIARKVPEIVVVNTYGPLHGTYSSPSFNGVIDTNHLMILPDTLSIINPEFRLEATKRYPLLEGTATNLRSHDFSEVEKVRALVNENFIACNPHERFHSVLPGQPSSKPYSARQMKASNSPLNDFEQAAHDARQMGWLLETCSQTGLEVDVPDGHTLLVLPSLWHLYYLEQLTSPERPTQFRMTASLDAFIIAVLKEFRGSVLTKYLQEQGTIRERVYEMEFYWCAEKLAGACFLTPQASAATGGGFADFVVRSREWVIELVCDGNRIPEHMARISKMGKYTQTWPKHESRLVDFCFTETKRDDSE